MLYRQTSSSRLIGLGLIIPLWIAAFQILQFIDLPDAGLSENRSLAPRPRWPENVEQAFQFPLQIDDYLKDHFPLRRHIIAQLNRMRYFLGYSVSSRVIVGQDGWLFFDDGDHLAVQRGQNRMAHQEISAWVSELQRRSAWLKSKKISYYLFFPPLKETIYPEKLPEFLRPEAAEIITDVDDIIAAANAQGMDHIIDVRPALRMAKNGPTIYTPYDWHWTGRGAYLAYAQIMTRIAQDHPDLAPKPLATFDHPYLNYPQSPNRKNDLSYMLGIAKSIPKAYQPSPAWVPPNYGHVDYKDEKVFWKNLHIITTDAQTGRSLLMIRDSFAEGLLPMLASHFDRIIVAHDQQGTFRRDLIELYHPDIVILENIEIGMRYVMNPPAELN